MIFQETEIPGIVVVSLERLEDERGYFARTFCTEQFAAHGIDPRVAQCSTSFSARRHTVRGLHFLHMPHGETKMIRCPNGEIFDVAVDLRPDSPTFLSHHALRLCAVDQTAMVIPPGCAHGFLTLTDGCIVTYQMSVPYVAGSDAGVRWNDPDLGIAWPESDAYTVSDRDAHLPMLAELIPGLAEFTGLAGRTAARRTDPSP